MRRVVIDIEANALRNPTKIWVIVCKDIDTGVINVFREPSSKDEEKKNFLKYSEGVGHWIGHNFLEYDYPVLSNLLGLNVDDIWNKTTDTLLCSRMYDYSRTGGHSIEAYGEYFGQGKLGHTDFTRYSEEMERYCIRDVEICNKIYLKFQKIVEDKEQRKAIELENRFQLIVNDLHNNGFCFNLAKAKGLLEKVEKELSKLDEEILKAFPPKLKLIKEITPKETKHGTISLTDFRWVPVVNGVRDLSEYNGGPFCRCDWNEFNPASHKQVIEVLNQAGWKPTDKTQTHIECERDINRSKYQKTGVDLKDLYAKLDKYRVSGWKINEQNLSTLPDNSPSPARSLAKRILYEARRRTLVEWLELVQEDERIHGKFVGIGAWTHRMAHQEPNTANIPNEFDTEGKVKLLGKEMRQLWKAPKNKLLVGVDAEGIQLRIFAHYIDDEEFTNALINGKKSDKSDPHSLNARILGPACKTRAAAKRFIFAMLLGAGISKLAEVLASSEDEARSSLDRLMARYGGFAELKGSIIPRDAKRGWFSGLDGRKVAIPGETSGERKHLCMSGYLQNGEALVMKYATVKWYENLKKEGIDFKLVNFVHDEWQTEVKNDMATAILVAKTQSDALREVGEELKLKCPLAGSYWNEDHNDYTIGTNWYQTH